MAEFHEPVSKMVGGYMPSKKKCRHTKVIFRTDTAKEIPEGYKVFSKKDDVDLEDYKGDIVSCAICANCGEPLEEPLY